MNEAYCCECMRESCSTRAKLALGDLEIEGQKVPGLHITLFLIGKSPSSIITSSDETGERTLHEVTWN